MAVTLAPTAGDVAEGGIGGLVRRAAAAGGAVGRRARGVLVAGARAAPAFGVGVLLRHVSDPAGIPGDGCSDGCSRLAPAPSGWRAAGAERHLPRHAACRWMKSVVRAGWGAPWRPCGMLLHWVGSTRGRSVCFPGSSRDGSERSRPRRRFTTGTGCADAGC